MMSGLRQCILSIIAAAFISSMVKALLQDSKVKEWLQFICSVYIAVILLNSFRNIDYREIVSPVISYTNQADQYMLEGKKRASDSLRELIKAKCEAYILGKASQLESEISVEIHLSEDDLPVPEKVIIYGTIAPYAKGVLTKAVAEDLGIPKEAQVWIG